MSYPSLKITILGSGTSSGIPMIACTCPVCISNDKKDKRLRSSILVESKKTSIVIDTSPDFRYQMLRHQVKKLDAVLFTHSHKDHIAGLDDVRAYNFSQQKPIEVYATVITQKALKREFEYVFSNHKYPGIPNINLNTISLEEFTIGDIPIAPILVWHLNMPVLGFRFGKFTYITDANRIDDNEKEKIRGSEVLILNALRKQKHISHFTLGEAIDLVQELQIPKAYFTHISHQLGLHREIEKELPKGMLLLFDEMGIEI